MRYSIKNPLAYINSNIVGFANILEGCRNHKIQHLVYASTSSVYGANTKMPFSVRDNVDHPLSLYAASKKSNELMAHTYSHLYNLPTTGLRFFTVYGPWGRPDMAYWKFTEAILRGHPIELYNHGKMRRDFTYVDDVVESLIRLTRHPAIPTVTRNKPDLGTSNAPWRIFNIGNHSPTELLYLVSLLEKHLDKKAIRNLAPMQPGDVKQTFADIEKSKDMLNYNPKTDIEVGIHSFIDWYLDYVNQDIL